MIKPINSKNRNFMKRYNVNPGKRNGLLLSLLACSLLIFFACKKDNSGKAGGPPTISRIRLTAPTTKDSSLKQANLGATLAIVGNNFLGAQSVSFNGYTVTVNPVYVTNTDLVITVPDSVPTVATNPNVPNQIKVTTPLGTATYSFVILPPPPIVIQISNEFATPGQTITLYGKYFFFVDTVLFPGNVGVGSGITTSSDGSSLTVKIPAGVANGGNIQVKSHSGWSTVGRETQFYDHSGNGIVVNWDNQNSWGGILNFGWGVANSQIVSTYTGITPIDNNFAVVSMAIPANWGWSNSKVVDVDNYDGSINNGSPFPATPAAIYDANLPLADFDIKFEAAATQPVGALMVQIWQQNGSPSYTINIPLSNFIHTSDGTWYTVSANLGTLLGSDGSSIAKYGGLIGPKSIRWLIVNSTGADIAATIAFDNLRIVKVQ
jgi:Surface glycan-binding protein B xyloglucan binding domain